MTYEITFTKPIQAFGGVSYISACICENSMFKHGFFEIKKQESDKFVYINPRLIETIREV